MDATILSPLETAVLVCILLALAAAVVAACLVSKDADHRAACDPLTPSSCDCYQPQRGGYPQCEPRLACVGDTCPGCLHTIQLTGDTLYIQRSPHGHTVAYHLRCWQHLQAGSALTGTPLIPTPAELRARVN